MNSRPDCRDEKKKLRQKVNNEVRSRQEEKNRREGEKMMQEWAMFKKMWKKRRSLLRVKWRKRVASGVNMYV